jgi:folate-binding protein YgfZ
MPAALHATDRAVLELKGADARDFLQGLITNDMARLDAAPALYAAMLTPQGKYLFDFFVVAGDGAYLIDVKADRAAALAQRLAMYRLRARVEIAPADLAVVVGTGDPPAGAWPDPRDARLGWRTVVAEHAAFVAGMDALDPAEPLARRIALGVPESGVELAPDDAYILEMGFERLNGVDFRKGCYVGQEVTARMKHKTELKKGLARVAVEGPAPAPGTAIEADGRPAGTLWSAAGGEGLAYLRFDRADGDMQAGDATVRQMKDFPR